MSDNENCSAPYIGDAEVKPPVPIAVRRLLFIVAVLSDLAAAAVGLLLREEGMLFTLFLLGFGQIFLSTYIVMRTKRARCTKYVAGQVIGTVRHPKVGVLPVISYVIGGERGTAELQAGGGDLGLLQSRRSSRGHPGAAKGRDGLRHRGRDRLGDRGAVSGRSPFELYPAVTFIRERT